MIKHNLPGIIGEVADLTSRLGTSVGTLSTPPQLRSPPLPPVPA